MKAILQHQFGGKETLYLGETILPEMKTNHILVRVKAFALNRADILQREGHYPPPLGASTILGLECAGIVEKSNSPKWKPGDEILTLVPGGAYAENVLVHEDMPFPKPKNLNFEQAAAIPEAFLTAWQTISWLGKAQKDEIILIHAGASGVGNAAIQISKALGLKVFTTCSSNKIDFCKNYGVDEVINYQKEDFESIVLEKTHKKGANIILDCIGGTYLQRNIRCLALDGRIVQIASLGGNKAQIDIGKLLQKRGTLEATTLRSRSQEYQIRLARDFWDFAEKRFQNAEIKPAVDRVFDWKEISEAHAFMESNQNKGKIVVKVSD